MIRSKFLVLSASVAMVVAFVAAADGPSGGVPASQVRWKKTVIDKKFRSEGVAVADINKDGKLDIVAGDVWYEAPDWKMHEIRPITRDYGDGAKGYSESFGCFVDDFNGDGWPDVIVIPFPGKECYWYENPKNQPGHWKKRMVWRSACNETPQFVDLFGDGKKRLIMGSQPEAQLYWFSIPSDIDKPWEPHPISAPKSPGADVFYHGLGVGDMNGDGRLDVIIPHGWFEQPPDAKVSDKPWSFHQANLGDPCADMFAFDVDGDGLMDVISSSAHRRGIWWHKQQPGSSGNKFQRFDIMTTVTETHAMNFVDINGDGKKDIVTGKRWWAHGPTGDEDPMGTPFLYWIEIKQHPGAKPEFVPHEIDNDSGIGTQFVVTDVNGDGLPDVVISNKRGVFLFEQVRGVANK